MNTNVFVALKLLGPFRVLSKRLVQIVKSVICVRKGFFSADDLRTNS